MVLPGMPPIGPAGPPPAPDPGMAILQLLPPQFFQQDWGQPIAGYAPQQPQAPTMQSIQERAERLKTYWDARDTRMQDDQDLYDMTEADNASATTYISNLPYVTVEKISQMIGGHTPVTHLIPPQNALERVCQKVEDLLRYAWDTFEWKWSQVGQNGLRRSMAWYAAQRGWVATRISYNSFATADDFPITLKVVDPIKVYPFWGDNDLEYVIYRDYQLIGQVMDEWPEAAQMFADREETEVVEVIAYYDRGYHAVLVDSQEVKQPTPHGFGFCPWIVHTVGGSPVRSDTRLGAGTDFIKNIGPSIYHGTRVAYKMRDTILSQLAEIVASASNPPILVHYSKETGEPVELSLAPGASNYMIKGKEDLQVINPNPNPAEVAPLLNALNDDVYMGSIPKVLWGGADPQQSGLAIALLTGAARDSLLGIITALQNAEMEIDRKVLSILRDIHQQPVGIVTKDATGNWIGGATVTPQEIAQAGVHILVEYKDVSPKDRFQLMQMALALTKENLISMQTARSEYLDIKNPERENFRILDEMMYKDEEVMKSVLVPWSLYRNDPMMFQVWQTVQQYHQLQQQTQVPPGAPPPNPSGLVGNGTGAPPTPGIPPTLLPPQFGPAPFNALQQAQGASAGASGLQRAPGVPGVGGLIPGGNGVLNRGS